MCFIKKDQANVATTCRRCNVKNYNNKTCAKRREFHRELRVSASSSVGFRHLDDAELKERASRLHANRSRDARNLDRVEAKLTKTTHEFNVLEKLRLHCLNALEELGSNKTTQEELEDRIFQVLEDLEAAGDYDDSMPPIT